MADEEMNTGMKPEDDHSSMTPDEHEQWHADNGGSVDHEGEAADAGGDGMGGGDEVAGGGAEEDPNAPRPGQDMA